MVGSVKHDLCVFALSSLSLGASPVLLVVKNPPANAGDIRDSGSMPGSGRSPGEGNGNPLQYTCLENSMDRGAWQAIVHEVANSQTQLTLHFICVQLCTIPRTVVRQTPLSMGFFRQECWSGSPFPPQGVLPD